MYSNFHALLNATIVATTQPESSIFATTSFAATAKAAAAVLGAAVAIGVADVSVQGATFDQPIQRPRSLRKRGDDLITSLLLTRPANGCADAAYADPMGPEHDARWADPDSQATLRGLRRGTTRHFAWDTPDEVKELMSGMRSHEMTPDDWEALFRWLELRHADSEEGDVDLAEADVRRVLNKYLQTRLVRVFKTDEQLRENFLSGAELAAAFKEKKRAAEREAKRKREEGAASLDNERKRKAEDEHADFPEKKRARVSEPVDVEAAMVPLPASVPLPDVHPAPNALPTAPQAVSPPPEAPSLWSSLTNAVSRCLKRKRGIDGDISAPTQPETDARAPSETAPPSEVAVPAPSSAGDSVDEPATKRARVVQQTKPYSPDAGESVNKYHDKLAGRAAFPFLYSTSEVKTQTGHDAASAWCKRYSTKKATPALVQLAESDAFLPLPVLPPPRKSALKTTAGPGPTRHARFALYNSLARPPRRTVPPAADKVGLDYTIDRMLRPQWTPPPEPQWTTAKTVRPDRAWSHPVAKYKTYCDASVQCPDDDAEVQSGELALEVDEGAMLAAAKDWWARSYALYLKSLAESMADDIAMTE